MCIIDVIMKKKKMPICVDINQIFSFVGTQTCAPRLEIKQRAPKPCEKTFVPIGLIYMTITIEYIYTTKIIESVCVYVCMSGYAFCHALRYPAETWHGGRGWAHEVCGHIFEAAPPGVKGHPGVNLP